MKTAFYPSVKIGMICQTLIVCCCCPVRAAERLGTDEVTKTIRQLGSASFVAREDATQRLLYLGEDAEDALSAATKHADREIRDRSQRMLNLIRKQQQEAKLTAFRQASKELDQNGLPGWKQFSNHYGTEAVARNTFANMLESEWNLLADFYATESREQQRALISGRYFRLERHRLGFPNYSVGTMLTFFFLAAEKPDSFDHHPNLSSWMRHRKLNTLLSANAPEKASPEGKLVRNMVGAWIVAASGPYLGDRLALQTTVLYRLHKEGGIIAKRVLTDDASLPMSKSTAMQAIVLRQDKSQRELIEPFLEDRTVLSTTGKRQRQLRDVALACLMQLNGHDVAKIGVKSLRNTTYSAFDYNSLGFISEADRERAFQLFRKLQAERNQKR